MFELTFGRRMIGMFRTKTHCFSPLADVERARYLRGMSWIVSSFGILRLVQCGGATESVRSTLLDMLFNDVVMTNVRGEFSNTPNHETEDNDTTNYENQPSLRTPCYYLPE